ncbi:MAG TPA: type II toxin-antitoxin system CcdA family antitoxin [Geminicoccaceae bacterium]|nr:type II toxin-antitoxin system CcdA family antitoxin [Geminicoccaceae bacterium]
MRNPPFDSEARKRTVSVTLNADLYAKAKGAGINVSKVAEEALAQALRQHLAERARAEIRQDLAALSAFVEAHGSFADMVREHYATVDSDAPV